MAQTIYYIVASIGIIFTGIMTFLSYKFNEKTKKSEANVKELANQIKNIYEAENKTRLQAENISKLLVLFSNIDRNLEELNKSDDMLNFTGISVSNAVENINKEVANISEYSFVFTDNRNSFDSGDYDSLDILLDNPTQAIRQRTVKSVLKNNSKYKNFLRSIYSNS